MSRIIESYPGDTYDRLSPSWETLIEQVFDRLARRLSIDDLADRADRLLQAMPLTCEEYAVARMRLTHIQTYANDSEWGAAAFELRLLQSVGRPAPMAGQPQRKVNRNASIS